MNEAGQRESHMDSIARLEKPYPFSIRVLALLVRSVQINAIQATDHESHDELEEANDGKEDVGERHVAAITETHRCGLNYFECAKSVRCLRSCCCGVSEVVKRFVVSQ